MPTDSRSLYRDLFVADITFLATPAAGLVIGQALAAASVLAAVAAGAIALIWMALVMIQTRHLTTAMARIDPGLAGRYQRYALAVAGCSALCATILLLPGPWWVLVPVPAVYLAGRLGGRIGAAIGESTGTALPRKAAALSAQRHGRAACVGTPAGGKLGTVRVMLVGLAVVLALPGGSQAQSPLSARQMDARVEEYCDAETGPDRSAAIVEELRGQRESRTYAVLRRAARDDADRWRVCRLVAALRHPKAWDILGRYLDTPDQPDVVDALLAVADPESLRELLREWDRADADTPLFDLIADGLARAAREHRLDGDTIAAIARWLDDDDEPARQRAAADVVSAALALDDRSAVEGVEGVRVAWQAERPTWALQSATMRPADRDAIALPMAAIDGSGGRLPRGANRRMTAGDTLRLPPAGEAWTQPQRADHTIWLHLLLLDADAAADAVIACGSTEWTVTVSAADGTASIATGDDPPRVYALELSAAAARGREWLRLGFRVTVDDPDADPVERSVDARLDGDDLRAGGGPRFLAPGRLDGVRVACTAGTLICAPFQVTPP